jgi:hypothetical protein
MDNATFQSPKTTVFGDVLFKANGMMGMKFKSSMLEYSKLILSKMTFDKKLFKKEFRKAFRYLDREERRQLIHWIRSKS